MTRLTVGLTSKIAEAAEGKSQYITALALSGLLLMINDANALDFEIGSGENRVETRLELTASYSAAWRTESMDESILNPNNDDGNRAFRDSGSLVSNRIKVGYDLTLAKDFGSDSSFGFFNRGLAFHDNEIKNASNEHNSPTTNNGAFFFGGSLTDLQTFTEDTQDRAGQEAKWLDAYAFYNGNKRSKYPHSLRVGAQVINWGENAFIQSGISNAINPADISQANVPGTEVKDILLPQRAVFGQLSLTNNVSVEAFYQWQWEHTIAPPVGTFLSTNDFIAEDGGENLLLPAPPGSGLLGLVYARGDDLDPEDGGQWGAALRWYAEALNGTDFGFYYVNYHSKLPSLAIAGTPRPVVGPPPSTLSPQLPPGQYQIQYFEDIKLYGLSFNTVLYDIAFSGEVSYREDFPLQTVQIGPAAIGRAAQLQGSPLSLSTREDIVVSQLTLNKTFSTTPVIRKLADDVAFLVEFGHVYTPDLDDGEVFRGATPVDSKTSWGFKSQLTLTYFDKIGEWMPALSGTDLVTQIFYNQDVDGTSAIPAGSFTDNVKSAGLSLRANWQNTLELELRYNSFFGSEDSGLTDRDHVSLTAQYKF